MSWKMWGPVPSKGYKNFSKNFQNCSGAHTASWSVGPGFFLQGFDSWGKKMNTHFHPETWLRMSGGMPLLSLSMTHWHAPGQFYPSRHICKLKKVNISFVMWISSVCPSTQNNSNPTGWTSIKFQNLGFLKIKSVEKISVWLQLDKNNRSFTCRTTQ
jgi:hypothetical protein